jgi:hypothetical protein
MSAERRPSVPEPSFHHIRPYGLPEPSELQKHRRAFATESDAPQDVEFQEGSTEGRESIVAQERRLREQEIRAFFDSIADQRPLSE